MMIILVWPCCKAYVLSLDIKERAVLCIRTLMEGNERNQALVRDMHVLDTSV